MTTAKRLTITHKLTVFALIWLGQLVSLTGSGLTSFALGVWVYQSTGSTTQYALISFFTFLPTVVLSPVAGVLVDRWDRRWVMMLGDAGAGLSTLAPLLLLVTGRLEIWHIYLATTINSIGCVSFELKVKPISGRVCLSKLLKEMGNDFQLSGHYTGNSRRVRDAT